MGDLKADFINEVSNSRFIEDIIFFIRERYTKGNVAVVEPSDPIKYLTIKNFEYNDPLLNQKFPINCTQEVVKTHEEYLLTFDPQKEFEIFEEELSLQVKNSISDIIVKYSKNTNSITKENLSPEIIIKEFFLSAFKQYNIAIHEFFSEIQACVSDVFNSIGLDKSDYEKCDEYIKSTLKKNFEDSFLRSIIKESSFRHDLPSNSLYEDKFQTKIELIKRSLFQNSSILTSVEYAKKALLDEFFLEVLSEGYYVNCKIWARGMYLETEASDSINSLLKIRKPNPTDFENKVSREDLYSSANTETHKIPGYKRSLQGDIHGFIAQPFMHEYQKLSHSSASVTEVSYTTSFILEKSIFSENTSDAFLIEEIVNSLKIISLYKLASVNPERIELTSKSHRYIEKSLLSSSIEPAYYWMHLSKCEIEELPAFYNEIFNQINFNSQNSLAVSVLSRYCDVVNLSSENRSEKRLFNTVSILESILIREGERGKNREGLSKRLNKIIRSTKLDYFTNNEKEKNFPWGRKNPWTKINDSYDIRNCFAHGQTSSKIIGIHNPDYIQYLCKYLLESLRVLTLILIQKNIDDDKSRETFISEIDDAISKEQSLNIANVSLGSQKIEVFKYSDS